MIRLLLQNQRKQQQQHMVIVITMMTTLTTSRMITSWLLVILLSSTATTTNAFQVSSKGSSSLLPSSSSMIVRRHLQHSNRYHRRNDDHNDRMALYSSNKNMEPLATKGDWSAYLDEEQTGLIYYFNGKTGVSLWEPPTDFPPILLTPAMRAKAEIKQEAYIQKIQQKQMMAKKQLKNANTNNNNFFAALLSTDESSSSTTTDATTSRRGQSNSSDWFSTVVDDVMTEQSTMPEPMEPIIKQQQSSPSSSSSSKNIKIKNKLKIMKAKRKMDDIIQQTKGDGLNNLFGNIFNTGMNKLSNIIDDNTKPKPAPTSPTDGEVDNSVVPKQQESSTTLPTTSTTVTKESSVKKETPVLEKNIVVADNIRQTPTISVTVQPTIEMVSLVLPHPAKVLWGGEDAVFMKGRTFGIFDGVSGAKKAEGQTLYSKMLAYEMTKQMSNNYNNNNKNSNMDSSNSLTMTQLSNTLLQAATVADAKATGASTAILGHINADGYLRVLNVGDSGCMVIRKGKVISKTREISHYFECPYQLSKDSPDRPRDGTKFNIELQKGDIIFMASDGVFDNLYDQQIADIITDALYDTTPLLLTPTLSLASLSSSFLSASSSSSTTSTQSSNNSKVVTKAMLQNIAKKVCEKARKISLQKNVETPYAKLAKRYNDPDYRTGLGGKLDDISCIIIRYD